MPTTSSGEMTNATVTGAAIAGYELSEAVAAAMVTDAALHTIAARATDRISLADYTGADVIYERNRHRNLFAVINGGEFPASWLARDNIIACDPASVGYSGSNAGVGLVPAAGPAFAHMIEDGNPADVGMGETFNAPPVSAGVMPSEGPYVAGHIVWNSAPAANNGQVLLGWVRLTTGSGNAVGADWLSVFGAAT